MSEISMTLLLLLVLFVLLGSGIWVAFSLLGRRPDWNGPLYRRSLWVKSLPPPSGVPVTHGHWLRCRCLSGWGKSFSDRACPKTCSPVFHPG